MIKLVDEGNALLSELAALPAAERSAVRHGMNLSMTLRLGTGLASFTNDRGFMDWCAAVAPGGLNDRLSSAVAHAFVELDSRRRQPR